MQRLHGQAFFLYGVIVGLAIREALVRSGPHVFVPSDIDSVQSHLEAWRLVVFLLAISCFYFGALSFFDKVYVNPSTEVKFRKKNYGLDFGLGLVHFLLFFGWSITISDHSRPLHGISPFLGFMAAILLYDLVWLGVNIRYDTFQEIKLWAFMCLVVVFLSAVFFFALRGLTRHNEVLSEEFSFLPVISYLIVDHAELFSGRQFISEWIRRLLPAS